MDNAELQVENGHFTRIVNPLIERLAQMPFRGCELAVALFIIRKTYGYQKTQDSISLSQICKGVARTRYTVIVALKNLQLVNIAILVKRGNVKGASNIWKINKYIDTWKVGKTANLVVRKHGPSGAVHQNLGKTAPHTKERKKYTKETTALRAGDDIGKFIFLFKEINPTIGVVYGRPPQREASTRLLKLHRYEWWEIFMRKYITQLGKDRYCPRATTPVQLEAKFGAIMVYAKSLSTSGKMLTV